MITSGMTIPTPKVFHYFDVIEHFLHFYAAQHITVYLIHQSKVLLLHPK